MGKKGGNFGKQDAIILAQLLHTMHEIAEKMESYYDKKNVSKFNSAKQELLELQKKIDQII